MDKMVGYWIGVALALAMGIAPEGVSAKNETVARCTSECITIAQHDRVVIATVTNAKGEVLKTVTANLAAKAISAEAVVSFDVALEGWLASGRSEHAAKNEGVEVIPLPGGGSIVIIRMDGYDVIVVVNPDGTVKQVQIHNQEV